MMQYVVSAMTLNRFYAEQLVADIPDEQMCAQPGAIRNHPLWNLGHIALALDDLAGSLGLDKQIDESWRPLFGQTSRPTSDHAQYPGKQEVLAAFRAQHERVADRLAKATPDELAGDNPVEELRPMLPTLGDLAVGLATSHNAIHLGQISAWRREAQLQRVLPMDKDLPT